MNLWLFCAWVGTLFVSSDEHLHHLMRFAPMIFHLLLLNDFSCFVVKRQTIWFDLQLNNIKHAEQQQVEAVLTSIYGPAQPYFYFARSIEKKPQHVNWPGKCVCLPLAFVHFFYTCAVLGWHTDRQTDSNEKMHST